MIPSTPSASARAIIPNAASDAAGSAGRVRLAAAAAVVVLALTLITAPARADNPAASPTDTTADTTAPVTLESVVRDMAIEAIEGWRETGTWPRSKPDYAKDKGITLPREQVLRAISQPLHDHPALDGYLRWQMLSFEPDFASLTPPQLLVVLQQMPRVMREPRPNVRAMNAAIAQQRQAVRTQGDRPNVAVQGSASASTGSTGGGLGFNSITLLREQAFVDDLRPIAFAAPQLSVISTGTLLKVNANVSADGRYVTLTPQVINSTLIELRRVNQRAVLPGLAFRDAVVEALPVEGGMRLAGLMMDLEARIEAGSPTVAARSQQMVALAQQVGSDPHTPRATRDALTRQLRELYRRYDVLHSEVHIQQGSFQAQSTNIRLGERAFKDTHQALRGR